jgi:hypothetical protein
MLSRASGYHFTDTIVKKFNKAFQSASNPTKNIGTQRISANIAIDFASVELLLHLSIDDVMAIKLPKQNLNPTNIAITTEFDHSDPLNNNKQTLLYSHRQSYTGNKT